MTREQRSRGRVVGRDADEVDLAVVVDLLDSHDRPVAVGACDHGSAGDDLVGVGGVA